MIGFVANPRPAKGGRKMAAKKRRKATKRRKPSTTRKRRTTKRKASPQRKRRTYSAMTKRKSSPTRRRRRKKNPKIDIMGIATQGAGAAVGAIGGDYLIEKVIEKLGPRLPAVLTGNAGRLAIHVAVAVIAKLAIEKFAAKSKMATPVFIGIVAAGALKFFRAMQAERAAAPTGRLAQYRRMAASQMPKMIGGRPAVNVAPMELPYQYAWSNPQVNAGQPVNGLYQPVGQLYNVGGLYQPVGQLHNPGHAGAGHIQHGHGHVHGHNY